MQKSHEGIDPNIVGGMEVSVKSVLTAFVDALVHATKAESPVVGGTIRAQLAAVVLRG